MDRFPRFFPFFGNQKQAARLSAVSSQSTTAGKQRDEKKGKGIEDLKRLIRMSWLRQRAEQTHSRRLQGLSNRSHEEAVKNKTTKTVPVLFNYVSPPTRLSGSPKTLVISYISHALCTKAAISLTGNLLWSITTSHSAMAQAAVIDAAVQTSQTLPRPPVSRSHPRPLCLPCFPQSSAPVSPGPRPPSIH
ncbi:unnamed protein product [Pleuronectes platessa]|uniref:Uncharacterized protein n=1 Tax=Pleuronectes platessa TaxID=8262 RepID=A0A9N7YXE5_PLEPL|nr:unnamed protein product [Pleuronectes platessa]